LLHLVGDLFELNVKLRCQKLKFLNGRTGYLKIRTVIFLVRSHIYMSTFNVHSVDLQHVQYQHF